MNKNNQSPRHNHQTMSNNQIFNNQTKAAVAKSVVVWILDLGTCLFFDHWLFVMI
jgi:hypothetical protein